MGLGLGAGVKGGAHFSLNSRGGRCIVFARRDHSWKAARTPTFILPRGLKTALPHPPDGPQGR